MFYDEKLMNGKTLGTVWRAANNVTLETENAENDLSTICNKIDRWVGNETDEVKGRLSLRTSSTLVGGVTKLYRSGVDQLLDDVNKLIEDMSRGKKRSSATTGSPESSVISSTVTSPEEMRRQTDMQSVSITQRKKRKIKSVSPTMGTFEHTMDRPSSESSYVRRRSSERSYGDRFSGPNINLSSGNIENTEKTLPETKNQGTQTSLTLTSREGNMSSEDFNPNLPFGYIIIHDSFASRMPSRIIFSSFNADVNQLV